MILQRNLLLMPPSSPFAQPHAMTPPVEERQPVLFLEVNIGQGSGERAPGKLLLYEGDSSEDVVKCFASVYQLSENKRLKLLDIVRTQLNRML